MVIFVSTVYCFLKQFSICVFFPNRRRSYIIADINEQIMTRLGIRFCGVYQSMYLYRHARPRQQAKMAEHCRNILGDSLLTDPVDGCPVSYFMFCCMFYRIKLFGLMIIIYIISEACFMTFTVSHIFIHFGRKLSRVKVASGILYPADSTHLPNGWPMLSHRLWRWPSIGQTLGRC